MYKNNSFEQQKHPVVLTISETDYAKAEIYKSTKKEDTINMRQAFGDLIKMGLKAAAEQDPDFAAKLDDYGKFRDELNSTDTLSVEAEAEIKYRSL